MVEREIAVELQPVRRTGAERRERRDAGLRTSPFDGKASRQLGEVAARRDDGLDVRGKLSPPVRITAVRSRKVRLIELSDSVLELKCDQRDRVRAR